MVGGYVRGWTGRGGRGGRDGGAVSVPVPVWPVEERLDMVSCVLLFWLVVASSSLSASASLLTKGRLSIVSLYSAFAGKAVVKTK